MFHYANLAALLLSHKFPRLSLWYSRKGSETSQTVKPPKASLLLLFWRNPFDWRP